MCILKRNIQTELLKVCTVDSEAWKKASINQALPDKKISSLYKEFMNNCIVILVWRVFGFYTQTFIIIIIIISSRDNTFWSVLMSKTGFHISS